MTCFLLSLQKYGLWMLKYLYFVVKCAFTFWISNWTSFYLEFGLNIGHVSVIGIINNVCKNWVFAWIVAHMSCKKKEICWFIFSFICFDTQLTYVWVPFSINSAGITEGFSMRTGDFVEVYSEESQECEMTQWYVHSLWI